MILDPKYWKNFCEKTGMPLDQKYYDNSIADSITFENRARFEYKYCLWPRRCHKSKRSIWFTLAVRARAVWTGPGEPVVEDRWFHKDEGLMIMIKRVASEV